MNKQKELERIKKVKELKDSEIFILNKSYKRRTTNLVFIIYFSGILFIMKLAFSLFIRSVEMGYNISNFGLVLSGLLVGALGFIFYIFDYAFLIFFGLLIMTIYEKFINKDRNKIKQLNRRLNG